MAAAADAAAAGGSAAPPPPEQPHRPAAPPPAADRNQAGNPLDAGHPMSRRWVPAPGVHGLPPGAAALAHVNVSACHPYLGGELMVSSLVAASPRACLAALLPAPAAAAAGGVSILGPAAAVTLLAEPHPGCQLLHLRLAPPGAPSSISSSSSSGGAWSYWLRQLAAPREAVVQLSRSDDAASGISCVLFSSLPDGQARELLARRRRCEPSSSSSMQPAAGAAPVSPWPSQQHHHHHHHHHRHSWQLGRSLRAAVAAATPRWLTGSSSSSNSGGSGGSGCQLGSWLWRPVLVHVAGGFTVGGLSSSSSSSSGSNGCRAAAAGETLVTQLIKVDLRGWLCQPAAAAVGSSSSSSWLGRLGQGATDQLLQGMLSAVPVLKAQLEGQQQQQQQDREPHASGGGMQQRGAAGAAAVSGSCQPGTLVGALHGLLGGLLPWRWARGRGGASGSCSQAGVGAAEASAVSQAAAIAAEPEACRQLSQAGLSLVGVDANWQPLLGQCDPAFWSELHQPGGPAPFKVRGASYLTDRAKVAPGPAAFSLLAVDLVTTPSAVSHVARFLPAVRRSRASACFVANMMVPQPGSVLNLVMTFGSRRPWPRQGCSSGSSSSGSAASGSMHGSASSSSVGSASSSSATQSQQADGGWSAFDAALHRFVSGDDATRAGMLKMIPHVEAGPWLLRQSVGTTPFIVGRKLATRCFVTPRYVEVDIDVTTCQAAAYIVSSIRGMTTSLTIDLAFVLEGQRPQELPERLLGAVRFSGLDMAAAAPLDVGSEVPEWPAPWQGCGGSSGGGGCTTRAAPAGA